jgi:hypothetical protein
MDRQFLDLGTSPSRFTPGIHGIGRWVNHETYMDDAEKRKTLPLPGLEFGPLCRPARSQSLYRLSYPGSYKAKYTRTYENIET